MKIAITGKGGSGKTTIAATISRLLARRGYRVLAIDGDPNPNLAVALGVPASRRDALKPLPADLLRLIEDDLGAVSLSMTRSRDALEQECGVQAPDGVALLMSSELDRAGGG
jgi:CO dehydrogenase maturation factor